jgi:hypothetical protein
MGGSRTQAKNREVLWCGAGTAGGVDNRKRGIILKLLCGPMRPRPLEQQGIIAGPGLERTQDGGACVQWTIESTSSGLFYA